MKDNISTLYGALKNKGYTDIGKDETEFRNWLNQEGNVKTLYGALSQQGFDDIGDEQQFTDWVGVKKQPKSDDDAVFEANEERFRNGQPTERVTTQSMIDAHPELGLGGKSYQYKPEVQQHIIDNKPDMFKPKTVDMYGAHSKDKTEMDLLQEGRLYDLKEARQNWLQRPVTSFGEAFEQGTDALYQGGKNLVGETANIVTGSQRDYQRAKTQLDELVASGYDLSNFDAEQALKAYKDRDYQRKMNEWQRNIASRKAERKDMGFFESLLHKMQDPSRPKSQYEETGLFADELQLSRSYQAIQDALQKSNGNVQEAYKLLGQKASEETWGDETTREARQALASQRPTEGFGAWVGGMIPQMIGTGAGIVASLNPYTRWLARPLGLTNMAFLTGATSGMSMAEARKYAEEKGLPINEGDIWRTGLVDAAIEYGTERIPFNRYFGRIQDVTKKIIGKGVADATLNNDAVQNEVSDLLQRASKEFRNGLFTKENIKEYLKDVGTEGVSEFMAEALQTLSPVIYQNPEDYPTLVEVLNSGLEGAKGGLFMGVFLGGGSLYSSNRMQNYANRKRREKQGSVSFVETDKGIFEILGYNDGVYSVMDSNGEQSEVTADQVRDQVSVSLEEFDDSMNEARESHIQDVVDEENAQIDAATDPQTGLYGEVTMIDHDENGEQVDVTVNVYGEKVVNGKLYLLVEKDGQKEYIRPMQYYPETYQKRPAEEVKALNEEMIREEAAAQAELESKYAPEVLSAQMQQGVPFNTPTSQIVPVSPMPEGNGWIVEEYAMDENGKPSKNVNVREFTNDEYRDMLQAQLDAEQAVEEELAQSSESVGEQVNAGVNTEVNNPISPMELQESTPTSPISTQMTENVKPQAPVIPTKEDGSIDFVTYGKEGSFKTLGERYGEKMPNKVAVTAKAFAEDVAKAQTKLDKAQEAYDNAPIGREEKAKAALDKAQQELDAIKREADFWAEMDAEIKSAQLRRSEILNPQAQTESSNEPMTADEFVAQQLAAGNIVLNKDDYMRETGFGSEEANAMNGGAKKLLGAEGMTIQEAGERLMEMDRENGTNFFDQSDSNAGRDALISVLGSVKSRKELNQYIANNRAEQAKRDSEGLRSEAEKAVMDANFSSLEDFVLQMEAAEVENPFMEDRADEIMAIFAEEAAKYEQSLNNTENEQGRTNEVAEGSDTILSEEQSDDTGGTEERSESERVGDGIVEEGESAHVGEQADEVELKQQEGETILQFAERVAEENRRRPLRKRANEWSKALGVKVRIVESLGDVVNPYARRAIASGQVVTGWFEESTGEVCIYMPHVNSESEVDATYIHEVVAHKGLRGLLGEKFDSFCDEVWDMMSDADRLKFMSYPGVSHLEGKEKSRAAADEYIAHLAENIDVTESAWSKFAELVKKFLKAIGIEPKMTNADIANTVKKSYQRLLSGENAEGNVSGEGTRFRFSKTPQEFDAVQKEAVEKKGIVMPGLNEAVVDVLGIEKHDFNGSLKQAREAAKQWAIDNYQGKEYSLPDNGGSYTIGKKAINKYVDKTSIDKSDNAMIHLSALKELPNIISSSITGEIHADYKKGEDGKRSADNGVGDKGLLVHRMFGAIELDGKVYRVKTTMNEYRDPMANNTPHSYEVTEIELIESSSTPSLKDDSKPVNVSNNSISAANLLNGVEKSYDKGKKLLPESEKTRFRVAYHGSAADFDKFSKDFIGSGEGQAVMGHGFYVTTSEGTSEYYANVASENKRKIVQEGGYTFNGEVVRDRALVSAYGLLKDNNFDADKAIERANHRIEIFKKRKGIFANTATTEKAIEYLESEKNNPGSIGYQEEIIEKPSRIKYEVEIPDDTGKNYLDLDKKATKKFKDESKKRMIEILENGEESSYWKKNRDIINYEWKSVDRSDATNDTVRGTMEQFISQEEVANVFSSMGFVGSKAKTSDNTTYIIYNEDDIEIKDSTRFRVSNRNQGIIPLSERFNSATNDLRFRIAKEPAVAYATQSEAEDIVDVPRNGVKYTMNNIGTELYKVSGDYMRELYKNGTLGRVLRGEFAEIDQIKAKSEYDYAKTILNEYLNELVWMKNQATEAAQDVINDVIRDVEYSLDYYRDLALGKDVWRTKQSPRFRIVEKKKEAIQQEVDKFTAKYNSKDVVVAEVSSMTDEEIEEMFNAPADEVREAMGKNLVGGYDKLSGKIFIFVDNQSLNDLENSLFHENMHGLFHGNRMVNAFDESIKDNTKKLCDSLKDNGYRDDEVSEEVFVRVAANALVEADFKNIEKYLPDEYKEEFYNKIKDFGYEREQESNQRGEWKDILSGRRNSGRSDNSENGPNGEEPRSLAGTDGEKKAKNGSSGREQAERLGNLFGQVADMGLDGVLGNKEYTRLMVDIYKELPEDVRTSLADDALRHYGGSIAPAVSDYVNKKGKANLWDKIVGFIREALRKVGVDVNLNANDAKYILWRSRKPLERNNLLDMAEDIDMRYRLKVGEFEDSPTRFRVKKPQKIDLADERPTIIKEYDKELKTSGFNFQEAFQDRMLSVKVLMEKIEEETGKKAKKFEDAYEAENQLSSKNKVDQEKWLDKFYRPLLEELQKLSDKYGLETVRRYVYCKSGLERNVVLRQRDADAAYNEAKEELAEKLAKGDITQAQYDVLLDKAEDQRNKTLSEDIDYSGLRGMLFNVRADELFKQYKEGNITEQEYKQKVEDLKKDKANVIKDWKDFAEVSVSDLESRATSAEIDALWGKINAATNETLRIDFESGMIDRETYEAEKKMMKYYVPLRNWTNTIAEDMYEYRHDMTPAVTSNQKTAKGRESEASNPIATIALMAQNAIVRGNRNKMKMAFYSFVVNRPTALASVRNVWYVRDANNQWQPQYADTSAASSEAEMKQIIEQFENNMKQLEAQGDAFRGKQKIGMNFRASGKQRDEHVVVVMINGKEYAVYVNGNPRAAQAMNGLTNNEAVDDAAKWIDALKRYYGAGLTSWNPDFIIPNLVRDTIHATTMTFLDKGVMASVKYAANVPRMFSHVAKEVSGVSTGDPKLHQYFEEFVANGGETGYTAIHTLEDYKKEYDKLMNEAKGLKATIGNNTKEVIRKISKVLEAANRIAEDVNRFNAYVTSRESGAGVVESVSAAKNITVNFNRKGALNANHTVYGKVASWMSRWILFFNPSVQGIYQLVTKTKENPKRATALGASILASGFFVPMINDILVSMFGDDDDDYWNQSDYKRRNNWMLFVGDGYISVPLPPVLRELYGIGDIMYGVITGHIPAQRAVYDLLKQVQSAVGFVNVIPEVSQEPDLITYVKGFAPDIVAPFMDVISNSNFMGRPIAKWTDYNESDPEYERVYKGVGKHWVELSKFMNELGGNETRRSANWGNFINPAMMEHLFTSYTGGIGKTINNLAGMIIDAANGDTENMDVFRKTPVLHRFYTPNDEKTVVPGINRKFYEFNYQYNNAKKSLKKSQDAVNSGEHPEWQKYIDEMKENGEYEFIQYFEEENKKLKKIQNLLKGNPSNKKELEQKEIDKKAEIAAESFKILRGEQ